MIYSGNSFGHGSMRNTTSLAGATIRCGLRIGTWARPTCPVAAGGDGLHDLAVVGRPGRIAGIDGPVDRDWMKGNLSRGTVASIGVRPTERGTVTGERLACGRGQGSCTRLVNPGDPIALRAVPDDGARFVRWDGACAPAGEVPTCIVTALGQKVVSAVFGRPNDVAVPNARTVPEAPGSSDAGSRPGSPSTPTPEPSPAPAPPPEPTIAPEPTSTPEPTRSRAMSIPGPSRSPEGDGDGTRSVERVRVKADRGSYRWEREAPPRSRSTSGRVVTLFNVEGRRMGRPASPWRGALKVTTVRASVPSRVRTGSRIWRRPIGHDHPGAQGWGRPVGG